MNTFNSHITPGDGYGAGAVMNPDIFEKMIAPFMNYTVELFGPDENDRDEYLDTLAKAEKMRLNGFLADAEAMIRHASRLVKKQWEEIFHNTVTNEGRNDVLDKYFKGSSYTAAWYLGLKGTGSAAAGDTLASHAGWSEVTPYSGNRPAITWGTTSSQSNTASAVSYSITGTSTVAGAFIASVNTGTSGILYSAGDFAASRSVASGDTLNVTPTVSD